MQEEAANHLGTLEERAHVQVVHVAGLQRNEDEIKSKHNQEPVDTAKGYTEKTHGLAHLEAAAVESGRRLVGWHEEVVVRCVIESCQGCGLRRQRDILHGHQRPPADPRNEGG